MNNNSIDGKLFRKIFEAGAINLKNNYEEIDRLNVFPVPDGDTGTNMQMTMMSGVKEISRLNNDNLIEVSQTLYNGVFYGARGNSGAILSQFFNGVAKEIKRLGKDIISLKDFIASINNGTKLAYNAVSNPTEGTILTVFREAGERIAKNIDSYKSLPEMLTDYLDQSKKTLQNTPNLLPVLKEANVVDSGGAGFVRIIEGMLAASLDKEIVEKDKTNTTSVSGIEALTNVEITFTYCTEFIVKLYENSHLDPDNMEQVLLTLGDSLVFIHNENMIKVHVHSNEPGTVLSLASQYGEIQTCKIENMKLQHNNIITPAKEEEKPLKEIAVIAALSGNGIKDFYKELGVDYIVDGGQTNNPSTGDFAKAIKAVHAKSVIILPNNSNIILTAEQTKKMFDDVDIRIIKTKNAGEGYSALIGYDNSLSIAENEEEMNSCLSRCKSAEITYAIRDTKLNGLNIKQGNYIGIINHQLKVTNASKSVTAKTVIDQLISEESGIISIFYGSDVTSKELTTLTKYIETKYPHLEIETIEGKQEIYSYIISVE